ncbi:MAG: hypothetical protein ACI9F9_002012 [Candidatus Paceibacteria bacterium]|jgi:hypothetical protein
MVASEATPVFEMKSAGENSFVAFDALAPASSGVRLASGHILIRCQEPRFQFHSKAPDAGLVTVGCPVGAMGKTPNTRAREPGPKKHPIPWNALWISLAKM